MNNSTVHYTRLKQIKIDGDLNKLGPILGANSGIRITKNNKLTKGLMRLIEKVVMRLKSKKLLVWLVIMILVMCFLYYYYKKNLSINIVYAVVIDAGSTGSRIHVFKLYKNRDKTFNGPSKFDVKLIKELLVVKIKPGLSSYANEPDKASKSIKPLLDEAVRVIPKEEIHLARITLKATAGLRLIPEKAAIKILKDIQNLFQKYPFKGHEDVSILDGKYEGIYSWLTLNYALNNFEASDEYETCSLDLGGGSTQLTFVPTKNDLQIRSDDLVDFNLDQVNYKIFAKSFLGFGLMSARMSIFKKQDNKKDELHSVCMPPNHSSKWSQQNIEYKVFGPTTKEHHSYANCYEDIIKKFENNLDAPKEIQSKDVYAFSFFYDRLNAAKIFNNSYHVAGGGQIKMKEINEKALSICDNKEVNKGLDENDVNYPFLCMDLVWIYALLSKGYGLSDEKNINIYKEVNHMEISWALGQAFHLISSNKN